jgi:hypothetical protein
VYARNFGDLGSDNYADNDIQNLLFTANHFYGNWQLMTTVMTAQGNDDLKDNTSTTGSYALRSDNTAKNGYYAMLALHDKQQFYGLAPGCRKAPCSTASGWAPKRVSRERWRPDRERGLPALCVVRDPAAGEKLAAGAVGDSPAQRRPLSRRRPLRLGDV